METVLCKVLKSFPYTEDNGDVTICKPDDERHFRREAVPGLHAEKFVFCPEYAEWEETRTKMMDAPLETGSAVPPSDEGEDSEGDTQDGGSQNGETFTVPDASEAPNSVSPPDTGATSAESGSVTTSGETISGTPTPAVEVEVPTDWEKLDAQESKDLASKLTDDPVPSKAVAQEVIRAHIAALAENSED